MERKIQLVEERFSNKHDSEADELRRELEEARIAERMAKMQLEETRGPVSPQIASSSGMTVCMASVTAQFTASSCPHLYGPGVM